jgi:hypothetical protein
MKLKAQRICATANDSESMKKKMFPQTTNLNELTVKYITTYKEHVFITILVILHLTVNF